MYTTTGFSRSSYQLASLTEKANSLLTQGQYEAALHHFQQIPPTDRIADDWVNQAVCSIHLNQAQEALQVCDRALALDPHHPQAWLFKGVALHRLGRYDEAYSCYHQALKKPIVTHQHSSFLNGWWRRLLPLKAAIKHLKNGNLLRLWVN